MRQPRNPKKLEPLILNRPSQAQRPIAGPRPILPPAFRAPLFSSTSPESPSFFKSRSQETEFRSQNVLPRFPPHCFNPARALLTELWRSNGLVWIMRLIIFRHFWDIPSYGGFAPPVESRILNPPMPALRPDSSATCFPSPFVFINISGVTFIFCVARGRRQQSGVRIPRHSPMECCLPYSR